MKGTVETSASPWQLGLDHPKGLFQPKMILFQPKMMLNGSMIPDPYVGNRSCLSRRGQLPTGHSFFFFFSFLVEVLLRADTEKWRTLSSTTPSFTARSQLWKLRIDICKIDPSAKKEKSLLSVREINFDILIISQRKGWCWNGEL